MAVYNQNNLPGTIMTGSGMYYPQPNVGDTIPNFNQPLNEFAVTDSTFLDELQAQTGLLGSQIRQANPHATYTPKTRIAVGQSPDYINGVARNYFDPATNQFMTPEMNAIGGTMTGFGTGTGTGTGVGTGTYTPGAFGEYYGQNIPVVPPTGIISGTTGGPAGGGGSGRTDPVNPTAFDFPNLQTLPGWAGLLTGLFDLPQGTKFKWNPVTKKYEPESFVNVPEDIEGEPVSTWNPDKSTMTMDEAGNVTYGTNPYGIMEGTTGKGYEPDSGIDPDTSPHGPIGRPSYGGDTTDKGMANMEAMRDAAIADAQTQKDIKESKTFAESIAKSAYKGAKTGDKKNGKKEGPKHNGPARGGPGKGGPVGGPGHAGGHHF